MSNPNIQPITTADALVPLLRSIESTSEICIDTEADSLHHYFEKICLLQFTVTDGHSLNGSSFLVDPLAKFDLKPLFDGLRNKSLILHGADYDLRMLRADFKFIPALIFDTMLAARLAGHTTLGLDALVLRYTGKILDHGAQKADWSQRPLPPRLLNYAVEDTYHLPLLTQKLREELVALGRTEWHAQQCAQLIEASASTREKNANEVWRIKGSFDLDAQSLAILRELWKWRDEEARNWDRPPFMVLNNAKLLELTAWARSHPHGDLPLGPSLPKRWRPRRLQALIAALKQAWGMSETDWPLPAQHGKRPPYDPRFASRLSRLRSVRDSIAKEMKLDPSILAPQWMLEAIAGYNPQRMEDFKNIEKWLPWQTELLGRPFLDALTDFSEDNPPARPQTF